MIKDNQAIELTTLIFCEPKVPVDAAICLQGDGFERVKEAERNFSAGFTNLIIISGGIPDSAFNKTSESMRKKLVTLGVPRKNILLETDSLNTREQAINLTQMAKDYKWNSIAVIASHFHQLRAFLTFVKVVDDLKLLLKIYNWPAIQPNWPEEIDKKSRVDWLEQEIEKINLYQKKGHLASFQTGLDYQLEKLKYAK